MIKCPYGCGYVEWNRLYVLVHLNQHHRLTRAEAEEILPPENEETCAICDKMSEGHEIQSHIFRYRES